jgi:KipI family sensor histidine kinase inhibitor
MSDQLLKINPYGERAVLITWPDMVSESILKEIILLKNALKQEEVFLKAEMIGSYNSLCLVFSQSMDFEDMSKRILEIHATLDFNQPFERKLWSLPVCYDSRFGVDLEAVAKSLRLSVDQVIYKHAHAKYTVYGLGFLPGFLYLGGLSRNLWLPRREQPRSKVVEGSVAIADRQTGIYPQDSPGGWHILGNCPIPLFNVRKRDPMPIKPGDQVTFEAVDLELYRSIYKRYRKGYYKLKSELVCWK